MQEKKSLMLLDFIKYKIVSSVVLKKNILKYKSCTLLNLWLFLNVFINRNFKLHPKIVFKGIKKFNKKKNSICQDHMLQNFFMSM